MEGRKKELCIKYDESRDVWFMMGIPFDAIFTWKRTCKTFLCYGQVCHALLLSMYSLLNWWDFHLFLWFACHPITPCCTDYAVFVLRTCISSFVFYVNIPCKINIKEHFTNPIARINVGNVHRIYWNFASLIWHLSLGTFFNCMLSESGACGLVRLRHKHHFINIRKRLHFALKNVFCNYKQGWKRWCHLIKNIKQFHSSKYRDSAVIKNICLFHAHKEKTFWTAVSGL